MHVQQLVDPHASVTHAIELKRVRELRRSQNFTELSKFATKKEFFMKKQGLFSLNFAYEFIEW